jgi:hypothetical protein
MQKFQQNGLFDNVNLYIAKLSSKDILQSVLSHLLPLINGIVAIFVHSAQLVDIYHVENNKKIYEMNMKMMEKTRILGLGFLKYESGGIGVLVLGCCIEYVNFTGMILKTCTQLKLICIVVGFTNPHVPMGNRGC